MRMAFADVLPHRIQWRRSKNGFVTPQSKWVSTTLRPTLTDWAARPSARLREIVDVARLARLCDALFGVVFLRWMNGTFYSFVSFCSTAG